MNTPLVSVIIPTYNRRLLVGEAIDSVLAQTTSDYEIIVIDDGSTDGSWEYLMQRYGDKIRLIRQSNKGLAGARNSGLVIAKGKYVAFLDSDDLWYPEKLEKQIAFFNQYPDLGFLCTRFKAFEIGNEEKLRYGPEGFSKNFVDLLMSNDFIPTSTVLMRKDWLDTNVFLDENLAYFEDFDLWLRIAKDHPYDCLNEILVIYREHPQNTSKDMTRVYRGLWKFYEKAYSHYEEFITDKILFKRRAATFQYLIAAQELKKGSFREAFGGISKAIKTAPLFPAYFLRRKKAGWLLPFYLAKVYIVYLICFGAQLFPDKAALKEVTSR